MRRFLLPLVLLAGCPTGEPDPGIDPCEGGARFGSVSVLSTGFTSTEGLTFSPDGRLFVSAGDFIAEIGTDGTWESTLDLQDSVGLAWRGTDLIVASSHDGDAGDSGGVYALPDGAGPETRLTDTIEGPNFVTVTPWGTLLVSDAGDSRIFEVDGDETTVWLDGITSPNGLAFSPDNDLLWIATTFVNPAGIWTVPVTGGAAGPPTQIVEYEPGIVPDGLAIGASGDAYVALNLAGRVDRITAEGETSTIAGGVPAAASLAFGLGPFGACSLYVTSLFGSDVFEVGAEEPGLPLLY